MIRKCIFPKYSPITPKTINCTPENIEIEEAKNGKPGTEPLANAARHRTQVRFINPKNVVMKPIDVAARKGLELNEVAVSNMNEKSFLNE